MTLSYQRQYEDRDLKRGAPSVTRLTGQDAVHTIGTRTEIETKTFEPAPPLRQRRIHTREYDRDIVLAAVPVCQCDQSGRCRL